MHTERILALEVRIISFGFCVLDGPGELLDWGIRAFRRGVNEVKVPLDDKIIMLLKDSRPQLVVTNLPVVNEQAILLSRIKALSRSQGIGTCMISRTTVREVFKGHDDNKDDVASAIAARLKDLAPLLPARRRTWQAEHYRMRIFDAAALGLSYYLSPGKNTVEGILSPASH